MRMLFRARHGQSSWEDVSLADRDHPLTDKDKNDAVKMGKRLADSEACVDRMVASPAKRARATAETIARNLDFKRKQVVPDERLYTG